MTTRLLACALAFLGFALALLGNPDLRGMRPEMALRATQVEGVRFPKRLLDPSGVHHVLPGAPQRIASATLASDEILLELVGPEALAGVTGLVDDGALSLAVGRVPRSIPRVEARAEHLIPLSPDLLVVANYTRAETVQVLSAAGLPLLRLGAFTSFEDVFANIQRLAAATGTEPEGADWIKTLRRRIDRVEREAAAHPRPRVLYLAGGNYTSGPGSLVDEILTRAGARNCAREVGLRGSSPIATELAIALQPEIILLAGWRGRMGEATAVALQSDPRWQTVPALRARRVHVIPSALMLSVTHHAVDALEEVARAIRDPSYTAARGSPR